MTDPLPRIAILIPWFGPWPDYMPYFLRGCRANPGVSWILFSDQPAPENIPSNVKFLLFSLDEWIRQAEKKLSMSLRIEHPYKLCDLKPAYGYIFEEALREYDWWGYGDIDLVYGNFLTHYQTEDFLEFQVLSSHPAFVPAHLCLLKNSPEIRELFMTGGYFRQAFANPAYQGFDEQLLPFAVKVSGTSLAGSKRLNQKFHEGLWWLASFPALKPLWKTLKKVRGSAPDGSSWKLHDFNSILKFMEMRGEIKVGYASRFECDNMYKKQGVRSWNLTWDRGELFSENLGEKRSLLYFHFMLSKGKTDFRVEEPVSGINSFTIKPTGIHISSS